MSLLQPGTVIDRYVVEELVGQGGVAAVYRVRHQKLGSNHALKLIRASSGKVKDRLLREGQLQAELKHPNILPVTDVIDVGGMPGLIMEYIPGGSLERYLQRGRLPLEEADRLAQQVLAGVAEAHRRGVTHRDLKPANVLMDIGADRVVPKVADFGLAKILSADARPGGTRSGVPLGTPAYMAPEQVRDAKRVDTRADVFSLGALLYELVSGRRAFEAPDTLAVLQAVAEARYVPPEVWVEDLPPRMTAAIEAALRLEPNARPADASVLLALWRGEEPGEPAEADPVKPKNPGVAATWDDPFARSVHADAEVTVRLPDPLKAGVEPQPIEGPIPKVRGAIERTMVYRVRARYGVLAAFVVGLMLALGAASFVVLLVWAAILLSGGGRSTGPSLGEALGDRPPVQAPEP